MALRAGYYGLKRRIRDKLFNLLDAVPEGIGPDNPIASKSDVLTAVDLLDDTVGWLGGNILPIKLSEVKELNTSGTWSGNAYTITGVTFTFTEVNGYVTEITVNGTPTSGISLFVTKPFSISAGRYVLTVNFITSNDFDFQLYHKTDSSDFATPSIYARADKMEGDLVDGNYHARIHVSNGYAVNNVVLKPMLLTKEQYVFNPAYRPYHETVAEMLDELTTSASDQKTAINAIIAAATDAADFAAFQTAMGAITPVARSLIIQAPDTREASDPEPITKKSTKKSTAKAD